jgi:hypothetical protein
MISDYVRGRCNRREGIAIRNFKKEKKRIWQPVGKFAVGIRGREQGKVICGCHIKLCVKDNLENAQKSVHLASSGRSFRIRFILLWIQIQDGYYIQTNLAIQIEIILKCACFSKKTFYENCILMFLS